MPSSGRCAAWQSYHHRSNGCNQITQDHSRARSAQLNRGVLMGAKEFAVAPHYLLKVLRALPWVCGYRGHLDIE